MAVLLSAGGVRYFWYFYGLNSKNGFLGMMPGLMQAVIYKKKYIRAMVIKNSMGRAGETPQFSPSTNTQKGITIPNEQQWIYSIPGRSLIGPVMHTPQKNRELVGHI